MWGIYSGNQWTQNFHKCHRAWKMWVWCFQTSPDLTTSLWRNKLSGKWAPSSCKAETRQWSFWNFDLSWLHSVMFVFLKTNSPSCHYLQFLVALITENGVLCGNGWQKTHRNYVKPNSKWWLLPAFLKLHRKQKERRRGMRKSNSLRKRNRT